MKSNHGGSNDKFFHSHNRKKFYCLLYGRLCTCSLNKDILVTYCMLGT